MVHVNYNERMGYYYAPATNGKKCKVWLCGANCLWAEMNFYAKKEDGKEWLRFWRNCLKRAKRYWSMDAIELDRIQDGEQEDIDD